MKKAGIVGIGDMGSGLAKNLLKNGFEVSGIDLLEHRMQAFREMGGTPCTSVAEVARASDAVFVMVMTGAEASTVIFGQEGVEKGYQQPAKVADSNNGLVNNLPAGSAIILSATIKPSEARALGSAMAGSGVHLIDTPVSGGFPGAQNGTLTLMAAAADEVLDEYLDVMQAVSANIHRVGTTPGEGQVVKACLQSLIGAIFSATFEASVLAAKAGVSGEVLYNVFSTSSAGCGVSNSALENIIDRQFVGTGSTISTMHKDLTISLDLAGELGVPMHTAATAMQLFHAGKTKHPEGDNWVITKILEDIVGVELHR